MSVPSAEKTLQYLDVLWVQPENSKLNTAAMHGLTVLIPYLLSHDESPTKAGRANLDEALYSAVTYGHIDTMKSLLEHKADVHTGGDFVLANAAYGDYPDIITYLLDNFSFNDIALDRALIDTAQRASIECAKILLRKGADIHADNDQTVISAVMYHNDDMVNFLIDNKANVRARDDEALTFAAGDGADNMVRRLLDLNANPHSQNMLAIRNAAENGHVNIVKLLASYL